MFVPLVVLLITALAPNASPQSSSALRLTDIQIIGTHNSYHAGLAPSELALLRKNNPRAADSLEYRHLPLEQQLDMGVRQFELDVFSDFKGGLFANPAAPRLVAEAKLPPDPPFDPLGLLRKPGFKVIHVQDIDYRSHCQPFTRCLEILRDWSSKHPKHLPIFVLVENKDGRPRGEYMTKPEPLTTATFDALDAEIRAVLQPRHLITPDDVRGTHKTLEAAVLSNGWPTLDKARGKIIFLLDQERVTPLYTAGRPALEGRVLFTNGKPGNPDAAFVKVNDAVSQPDLIPNLVRKGYLIRTMTDGGVQRVRANDTSRRDAAINSGAQLLSTDYPFTYQHPASTFSVSFGNGGTIARCNPISPRANGACKDTALRE
jgi:hypothetical protein